MNNLLGLGMVVGILYCGIGLCVAIGLHDPYGKSLAERTLNAAFSLMAAATWPLILFLILVDAFFKWVQDQMEGS